jgi:glycosyltransferase EpsF
MSKGCGQWRWQQGTVSSKDGKLKSKKLCVLQGELCGVSATLNDSAMRLDMTGKPLRVAQVIGSISKGGVDAVVTSYYRVIDKSMIQFDFIIHANSPATLPDDILGMGCRVYKVPPCWQLPFYIKSLVNIFKEGKYKIVHSHMNSLSVFALFAAKTAGVPIRIAHSHSTSGKGELLKNLIKNLLRPLSKVCATHCFACSAHAGRWLFGRKAFQAGKIKIIKNAINVDKFKFEDKVRARTRRELGVEGKIVVGHVGRFSPQKNHMFMLEVFRETLRLEPESVLLLIGDGKLFSKVKEKAQSLRIANSILFLRTRNDLHELYQAMDVFLLPSLYEGLPISGLEAQCSGLPCIFSSEISDEASAGGKVAYVPLKASAKIWADRLLTYARIKDRKSLSDAFLEYHDVNFCIRELEDVYIQVIRRYVK